LVWCIRQGNVLNLVLELQVLADLVHAKGSLNVSRPCISLEAIDDCSDLAASLGDAFVQQQHDFSDGLAVDPSIFPEKSSLAIANGHGGGREEEVKLFHQEL
jgi:hypothetical protein